MRVRCWTVYLQAAFLWSFCSGCLHSVNQPPPGKPAGQDEARQAHETASGSSGSSYHVLNGKTAGDGPARTSPAQPNALTGDARGPARSAADLPTTPAAKAPAREPSTLLEQTGANELVPPPKAPKLEQTAPPELAPQPVAFTARDKKAAESPLLKALRCYMDNRPDEAIQWLGKYDKTCQDLLLTILPLAVTLTEPNALKNDRQEVNVAVSQLCRMEEILRARASLGIGKLCFCSVIKGYGNYKPLPAEYGLRVGDRVQLYAEIKNFSVLPEGDYYAVRLASHVDILKFNGELAKQLGFDDSVPELSHTARHDFFNNYTFIVPRIPAGLYTLKLHVKDVPTGRTAEKTIDFRVVGDE
jgi:hypothetical protein